MTVIKKLCCLILFSLLGFSAYSQVWFEDFSAEADGVTTGTAAGTPGGNWSSACNATCNGGSFSKETVLDEVFLFNDTDGEAVWRSTAFSIASARDLVIYIETGTAFSEGADYLRVYYELDNSGTEVLFHTQANDGFVAFSLGSSPVLNGTLLEIIVRSNTDEGGLEGFSFDNVVVTNTLYSRADNVSWGANGTWSAIALNGVDCGCQPNNFTKVIIGGTHDITYNAGDACAGLTINGTADPGGAGSLTWSGAFDLNIDNEGDVIVNAGGVLNGGNVGASISFTNEFTHGITNNGTFTIGDINLTNSNLGIPTIVNISGGSPISILDDVTLTESSIQSAQINNSGTLTIAGTTTINNNSTITNTGVVTMNNTAAATLAGSGTWTQGAAGTLEYWGNTITTTTFNASAASNTVNYGGSGNQTIRLPSSASTYHNLTISNANQKILGATPYTVNGNLSISGSAIFSANNQTLTLLGNWSNTSNNADPFLEGTGLVHLTGTVQQTITNTGDTQGSEFNNLRFQNTFGTAPQIVINNNVRVYSTFTMTQGIANLNSTVFTIGLSAALPGALVHGGTSASGFLYGGTITRFFNTGTIANGSVTGLFPMGQTAIDFRPFSLSCPTVGITTGGSFSLSVGSSTSTTVVSIADASPPPVTIIRQYQGAWSITNTAIVGGTYNIVAGGTGFGTIIALAHLRLHKVASALGTHVLATGTTTDPRLQRQGLTLAQLTTTGGAQWFVGSSDASSSLPIVLTYFKAKPEGDYVKTEWATAQEINNDFFTVQKTTDLETFYDLEKIPGQGNSREQHSYSLIDKSPFAGRSYYRLKQTDFDGKYTYSNLVTVDYEGQAYLSLQAYPNPSEGKQITIELKGLQKTETVPVQIYNQQGLKMYDMMLYGDGTGVVSQEVIFNSGLPQGLYIIKAGKTLQLTRKIVVN